MRLLIAEMQPRDPVLASAIRFLKGRIACSWEGSSADGIAEPRRKMRGSIEERFLDPAAMGWHDYGSGVANRRKSVADTFRNFFCGGQTRATRCGSRRGIQVRLRVFRFVFRFDHHVRLSRFTAASMADKSLIVLSLLTLRDDIRTAPVPRFTTYASPPGQVYLQNRQSNSNSS